MASANNAFKSHEDFRRARDLEEARKAGLAPAAVDEDGKEINPHIPQYMASAPWYLKADAPSLKHQRDWRPSGKDSLDQGVRPRGVAGPKASGYRKGACENCGAMTHKAKDCMERPRARGAKLTGKHIAPDEVGAAGPDPAAALASYAARRDTWRGYDPAEYDKVVDLYDKVEAAKKEMAKAAELEARFAGKKGKGKAAALKGGEGGDDDASSSPSSSSSSSDDEGAGAGPAAAAAAAGAPGGSGGDDDKVGDGAAAAFAAVEKRVRTAGGGATGSVRNLRIREDTAKYLLNLDPDSAYYDPKSRSMRQDPRPDLPAAGKAFAGDNFVRTAGNEYAAWAALEAHAARAAAAGAGGVHATAVPSQAAALHAAYRARKAALDGQAADAVKAKYGDAAAARADDPALAPLLAGQTEAYVEYDPATGRALAGKGGLAAAGAARSIYEEDVCPGNHTSVWGSWWSGGAWGYACCHATVRGAHCLGEAGKEAAAAAAAQMAANLEAAAARRAAAAAAAAADPAAATARHSRPPPGSAAAWGPDAAGGAGAARAEGVDGADVQLDPAALAAALAAEDERRAGGGGGKRRAGEDGAAAPTAEEMEAYRLKRVRGEDPMARPQGGGGGYDLV